MFFDIKTDYGKYTIEFFLTCGGCPEQYDIKDKDGYRLGYVHLRWGYLYAKIDGQVIYEHEFRDNQKGLFSDDNERKKYLRKIAKIVVENYI